MAKHQALTLASNNGLMRVLTTPVKVCTPILDKTKGPDKLTNELRGIWDTGASGSVITQEVVDALSLQPVSMTFVNTASEEKMQSPVYLVDVILPNGVVIQGLRVTLGKLANAQMLIGMDIINLGDFAVTNYQGKTKMTFRIPSGGEVDYVQELKSTSTGIVTDESGAPLSRQQRKALEREQFKKWQQEQKNK